MARKSSPSSRRLISQPHVLERPDGFYWQSDTGAEHGPFASLVEAAADMDEGGADVDDIELPDYESLEDAEAEVGVGWIDPLTGEPGGEGVPRLEDH